MPTSDAQMPEDMADAREGAGEPQTLAGDLVDPARDAEAEFRRRQHQRAAELQEIDLRWGGGLPYDGDRLEEAARVVFAQAGDLLFEGGRLLLLLKEHESHGHWLERVNRIGIDRFFAARVMKATVKFGSGPRQQIAVRLTRTKLFELMAEGDDALDALAEGGTLAGKTLDDVERMSNKELRAAVRAERKKSKDDAAAKDRLIEQKNSKLDELALALNRAEGRRDPDTLAQQQAAALGRDCLVALGGYVGLLLTGRAILEREEIPPDLAEAAVLALHRLEDRLDDLRQQLAPLFDAAPESGIDESWRDEVIATLGPRPQ